MKKDGILLFDVDGTICESGKQIQISISQLLNKLHERFDLGIVGGGTFEKIMYQLNNQVSPTHIFSECGSVYHIHHPSPSSTTLIYKNDIRNTPHYPLINIIVKEALGYLSKVDYELTGHLIDRRSGLIYISLIGMSATDEERAVFLAKDQSRHYRQELLEMLLEKSQSLGIHEQVEITLGGSVGIAIFPKAWNKTQVVPYLQDDYLDIYYFGDKYEKHGNDYDLIHHPKIKGIKTNNPEETKQILQTIFLQV